MSTRTKNRQSVSPASVPVQNSPTNTDLASAIGSITAMIVQALEAPLRMQVEACIQNIVNEATKDIHARIAAAVGQIQPIQIPINLFTQPIIQMPVGFAATPAPSTVTHAAEDRIEEFEEEEEEPEEEKIEELEEQAQEDEDPTPPTTADTADLPVIRRPAITLSTPAAVLKKPLSMTIVGLLPGQAHLIKDEFRFIKFQFIPSGAKAGKKLSSLAKTNDYVIQMVKFISHSMGDSVKAANGNWDQIPLSGGMSMLRVKVTELYEKHKKSNM